MSTPTISRSGRVLKKSTKLLEMETDSKISRSLPKTSNTPLIFTNKSSTSNIKIKLNLPGVNKTPDIIVSNKNGSIIQQSISKSNQQETNISFQQSSLIVNASSENNVPKLEKRSEQSKNGLETAAKRQKAESTTLNSNNTGKMIISPTVVVTRKADNKVERNDDSSPSSPLSNGIFARSIQEQRRINQANRAKLMQQQTKTPATPLRTPSTPASSNSRSRSNHSLVDDDFGTDTKRKKPSISAYVLWCKENRSLYHSNYPELDFVNLSKKMGEIWHTLPQNEKATWFKKAQMISRHGMSFASTLPFNSFYNDSDLKPDIVLGSLTLPITVETTMTFDENFTGSNDKEGVYDGEKYTIGTDLIDAQAYLCILGDSLMTISSYLQRGIKYNSEIDYSPTAALSTLLDTALVALGSLSCLTLSLPNLKPNKPKINSTLNDITYFMPPSDFI